MLSALFLLLAITLGGQGPLSAQADAASQSSTDLGNRGHRSTPFIIKQQFLVAETRDAKATPWDDGKPKAFLQSTGPRTRQPFHPACSMTPGSSASSREPPRSAFKRAHLPSSPDRF